MKNFFVLLLTFVSGIVSAESYICIPDKATGFAYNKSTKTWYTTSFNIQETKYILSNTDGNWVWKEVGKTFDSKCGKLNDYGFITCEDFGSTIHFNSKTLRFMNAYLMGYVTGDIKSDGGDTPSLEIGRCSKL